MSIAKATTSCARSFACWSVAALALLCAGCGGPQSILAPAGPAAEIISHLWWGMFSFFSLVLVVVVALWIYASCRNSSTRDAARAHKIYLRWIIGGGIILPLATVTVLLAFGIPAGQHVRLLPDEQAALDIEVVGHRWWWEVRYPGTGVVTANEFYLPVEQSVDVHLATADVIHSFWIPRLHGKLDLVPGRVHTLRLRASTAGPMRGQCAEFCGTGHAHMVLDVNVLPQDEFDAWLQQRQQPVQVAQEHGAAAEAFAEHCGQCHRVAGVTEGGAAPDLTNVGARRLLGITRHQDEHITLVQWLERHPTYLEGGATPDHRLIAADQHDTIAAWLETLGND